MLEKYLSVSHKQQTPNSQVNRVLRLFLERVPDDDDPWEALNLSPLHKIVTHVKEGDLATAASVAGESLNQRDSAGNTALLWAAKRGDAHSIKVLLDHGADATIGDKAD